MSTLNRETLNFPKLKIKKKSLNEIRRGKKERRKKNKPQHENIYGLPIP